MAAGFIADTASLPLVVSNLVNIVSADFFKLGFNDYAAVMVPVNIAAIIATLAMLLLFFRKDIPARYDVALLKTPRDAIRDLSTFRAGWGVLLLLLVGFFVLEPLGVPVSLVAAVSALVLLLVAKGGRTINVGKVLRGAPWQIVIFSLGMYLVVYGLRNAGLTDLLSTVLNRLADQGLWAATLGTGFITAFLSSVMNNLPTVLIGALSIDASSAGGVVKEAMIYANVIGSDLGPKITPIGSLATLLWLHGLHLGQKVEHPMGEQRRAGNIGNVRGGQGCQFGLRRVLLQEARVVRRGDRIQLAGDRQHRLRHARQAFGGAASGKVMRDLPGQTSADKRQWCLQKVVQKQPPGHQQPAQGKYAADQRQQIAIYHAD